MSEKRARMQNFTILAGLLILLLSAFLTVIFVPFGNSIAEQSIELNGAGATFPFPLIDAWRIEYQKIKPEININYQSIGSGGGVKQFTEKIVDFGATDAPLTSSEREKAREAVHIPETIGSIIISYNIPEVPNSKLKLTGPILADIYLGQITKWNDLQIQKLNPDLSLPAQNIIVAHRSDGSGTTFVWTDYLSKVSDEWKAQVGKGKSVQWPTGIGAPGNEGVASTIQSTPYAIGYVELSYALATQMTYAYLENQEGYFIEPSIDSVRAAVSSSAKLLPRGDESWEQVSTTDAPGKDSYPISSFSYLLLYKELSLNPRIDSLSKAQALVDFISWAISDGQQFADDFGYVALPEDVVILNQNTLNSLTYKGQPVLSTENGTDLAYSKILVSYVAIAVILPIVAAVGIIIIYVRRKNRGSLSKELTKIAAKKESVHDRLSPFLLKNTPTEDKIFRFIVVGAASYTILLLGIVAISIFSGSAEVFYSEGVIGFITGTDWNAVEGRESYGALPYVVGTLISSGIAMTIGVPISLGIAIFIIEVAPQRMSVPLSFVIELLAAVPSIIYGLWALFVFRFWIRDFIEVPLNQAFGGTIPIFAKTPFGLDIFTAGIVLAIMIIPTVSSISREVIRAVPNTQREAAYSLGATRLEMIKTAIFPYAKSGLFGAAILGLGRAVGETILVTMIIGNAIGASAIPNSLFSSSQTLASLIANEFNEAVTSLHVSALIGLGVVLFLLTIGINIGARLMVSRIAKAPSGRE
ncbi:MAG: phosphate ABC transporter substrate-binding protein PstS [Thermoproteota archaeon]|nr:phosphate ABC transporter substrate-binding protein PstS [Thermoproteota archaeon]